MWPLAYCRRSNYNIVTHPRLCINKNYNKNDQKYHITTMPKMFGYNQRFSNLQYSTCQVTSCVLFLSRRDHNFSRLLSHEMREILECSYCIWFLFMRNRLNSWEKYAMVTTRDKWSFVFLCAAMFTVSLFSRNRKESYKFPSHLLCSILTVITCSARITSVYANIILSEMWCIRYKSYLQYMHCQQRILVVKVILLVYEATEAVAKKA